MSVLAAISLDVGCGSSQRQSKAAVARNAKATTADLAKLSQTSAQTKADLTKVGLSEAQLQSSGTDLTANPDNMPTGNYTLAVVGSSYHYLKGTEELLAIHTSKVNNDAKGYTLPDTTVVQTAGKMDKANNVDSGRNSNT